MSDWERVNPRDFIKCEAPDIANDRECEEVAVLIFLPGNYRGTNGDWGEPAEAVCATHNEENRIYEDVICNECGDSVEFGSGKFVNRIPDFNAPSVRHEMGNPYPYGAFICSDCEGARMDERAEEEGYARELAIDAQCEGYDE